MEPKPVYKPQINVLKYDPNHEMHYLLIYKTPQMAWPSTARFYTRQGADMVIQQLAEVGLHIQVLI